MLFTLVILGAVCPPGRMPLFPLFKPASFCPLTLSFRERGNVQHGTAGENLFLKAIRREIND